MWKYSVWVGGSEMNSTALSLHEAIELSHYWQRLGYDDVQITDNERENDDK